MNQGLAARLRGLFFLALPNHAKQKEPDMPFSRLAAILAAVICAAALTVWALMGTEVATPRWIAVGLGIALLVRFIAGPRK